MLFVATLGGATAYSLHSSSTPKEGVAEPPAAPASSIGLHIPEEKLQLGEVWESNDVLLVFPVRNATTQRLTVADVKCSCNVTEVMLRSFALAPGEVRVVTLRANLHPERHRRSLDAGFEFTVRLTATVAETPAKSQEWVAVGYAKPWAMASASALRFGTTSVLAGTPPPPTVRVNCAPVVVRIEATCPDKRLVASVSPTPGRPHSFDVSVRHTAAPAVGTYDTRATLTGYTADGRALPSTAMPVEGAVVPDIQPSIPAVTFGAVAVGTPAEEVVEFHSLTHAAVVVTGMRVVKGEGIHLEPVSPTRVRIRTTPTKSGAAAGVVAVECKSGEQSRVCEVKVTVQGVEAR